MDNYKPIQLNNKYYVSIDGTVIHNNCELKHMVDLRHGKNPYHRVTIYHGENNQSVKKIMVHRLVADAFLPAPTEENCEIDHIDNDPHNNHASNLRWVTKSFNLQRRRTETMGRHSSQSTGYQHIHKQDNRYRVYIKRKNLNHLSSYPTLEEAIAMRNTVLKNSIV